MSENSTVSTAQASMDDALAQKVTAAFLAMRYDHPEHRQVLDLEHCTAFVPGTAEAEGLIA